MSFKLRKTEINQFRTTGIIKLSNFFDKKEILTLKKNLIKKLKKTNSFDRYYENLKNKKYLRRIEKLSSNSTDFHNILNKISTYLCKKNTISGNFN